MRTLLTLLLLISLPVQASFVAFESGQVRPLALSPDNTRLFVVNTPDNRLEIFDVSTGTPFHLHSVPVGLEPVAVAARTNDEVWVVNYLSDSISIVDVSTGSPHVSRTLLVGDEPADIVFAGNNFERAFITTAHRGQNSPYTDPNDPGEFMTPGIGRADVWVFKTDALGDPLTGTPIAIIELFGDTPKALAVTPDGSTVYAAVFKSGNQTTALHEQIVCNRSQSIPCQPTATEQFSIGSLPPPDGVVIDGLNNPEVGLIVRYNGSQWVDELGRDWSNMVRFNLPDKDVFAIDADALTPVETNAFSSVGTVLFAMAVNPVNGKVYVSNTEARNEVRFEGPGTSSTTVQGHLHESRITVIDPVSSSVTPRHLNKHINYAVTPAPAGVKDDSLAIPKGIAVTPDGSKLYVVAKGSAKIGVFNTAELENDSFVPDSNDHIQLSAGGPGGLVLDSVNNRLYVTTRFDNALSTIDTTTDTEISHTGLHNPEPPEVIAGRQFLYDANYTSSNGEASCASCHIEGDKDELAWDLGDPDGERLANLNPFTFGPIGTADFHPMKGPMTTQTLRGMDNHGPMHWRGDRSGANAGGDALDEDLAFKQFNGAFPALLGRDTELTAAEMQAFTDFILKVTPPPNPIRNLDNSLNADQQAGHDFYVDPNLLSDSVLNCNGCHSLHPASGFFGTSGTMTFEMETQHFKVPQLRNMYEKVGMFGMPHTPFFNPGDNAHKGDQIRGFGYMHDGSVDTLERFFNASLFNFSLTSTPEATMRKQMIQFMFAFDSNLKPVVGQQVTLNQANAGDSDVINRIDLLIGQALAGNADLIVKYTDNGQSRGAHLLANSNYQTDRSSDTELTETQLRNKAINNGENVTYTAVPPGSAVRMSIDRDEDGILDNDDNCPSTFNPTQQDTDSNGTGDSCEADFDSDGLQDSTEELIGTNPLASDSDGDGLDDFTEVNYDGNPSYNPLTDTNPLSQDTDADGFNDDIEMTFGSDPLDNTSIPADGDIDLDGEVDLQDLLLAGRFALGLQQPTATQLLKGDVAPLVNDVPQPDGQFNAGDLLVIQRKVLGLIDF